MSDTLNALVGGIHGGGSLPAPVVLNPLGAMQGALQTAGDVYKLRDAQATEALGQTYQAAIDPQTGRFDPLKFNALLAANPRAAMAAKGGVESGQTLQTSQYNLNTAQNSALNSALAGVLKLPDSQLAQGVVEQTQRLISAGVIPQDHAHAALLGLNGQDPATLRTQLETMWRGTLPPAQQQEATYGTTFRQTGPGGVTQGGTQQTSGANAGAVSVPPQPGAPQGLSAESAAAYQQWLKSPREYPDPANPTVTKHGTNETFLRDSGMPNQYIYPGGAPASPGSQASPLGSGRLPPALTNQNKPPATPAGAPAPAPTPAPAPSPAGSGIAGPTPAQKATADATVATGTLGPPAFKKEVDDGVTAQNQQAVLGNMLADTSQFFTGPQAGIVGKIRNLAIGLGIPGANVEAQTAKESFGKLAAMLANAQGAGSDARMNVNIAANPHEELSAPGVDLILRQLQGNADYTRARATLAGKYPDKSDYSGFQESVKELDPRAFQMARMTDAQRQTYWKSLDDTARKQIDAAGKKARELGVLGG